MFLNVVITGIFTYVQKKNPKTSNIDSEFLILRSDVSLISEMYIISIYYFTIKNNRLFWNRNTVLSTPQLNQSNPQILCDGG